MKRIVCLFALLLTSSLAAEECADCVFLRGDANNNGGLDTADASYITNWLFGTGPTPTNLDAADTDDDGTNQLNDAIYITNYLHLGGPQPPFPFPAAGLDVTGDALQNDCSPTVAQGNDIEAFGYDLNHAEGSITFVVPTEDMQTYSHLKLHQPPACPHWTNETHTSTWGQVDVLVSNTSCTDGCTKNVYQVSTHTPNIPQFPVAWFTEGYNVSMGLSNDTTFSVGGECYDIYGNCIEGTNDLQTYVQNEAFWLDRVGINQDIKIPFQSPGQLWNGAEYERNRDLQQTGFCPLTVNYVVDNDQANSLHSEFFPNTHNDPCGLALHPKLWEFELVVEFSVDGAHGIDISTGEQIETTVWIDHIQVSFGTN